MELINYETTKKRINIKVIFIISMIIIILLLTTYYFKIYKSNKNITKRYLISEKYICKKNICSKKENNDNYIYDLEKETLKVSNPKYTIKITNDYPIYETRDNKTCTFEKENYQNEVVSDNFLFDYNCKKYIKKVNKAIVLRNQILAKKNHKS